MNNAKTPTYWSKVTSQKTYPPLSENKEKDVVIIGAGLTGILTAYLLARSGKKVAIIEKDYVTDGVTSLTTAFLTEILDTQMDDLIDMFGLNKTVGIHRAHMKAIDLIEEIIQRENIDCDWKRCSDYIYVNSEGDFTILMREHDAANKIGINTYLSQIPKPGFKNYGYLEVFNQAKFHPIKFLNKMVPIIENLGVEIFERTEAISIDESRKSRLEIITSTGFNTLSEWVVSACYDPFGQPPGLFFRKGTYTSYVIEAKIKRGIISEAIYEDTDNPYHYFRIEPGKNSDVLIIGGEDHRNDVPIDEDKNFMGLEEYMKTILGDVSFTIQNRWCGPILEPADGLAFIGPYKNPRILYAFGFSGNGMTYAAIAANIVSDIINNKKNDAREYFDANRSLDPKSFFTKFRDYGQELFHGVTRNAFRQKKKKKKDNDEDDEQL